VTILYIVATPIGNLNDISLRALDVLKTVNYIACEDTRHTKLLLAHYGITTPVFSYHEHNEQKSTDKILKLLQENKSVALVSDAGTPLISDPGYLLVHQAHHLNITLSPIPGPCAAISALSISGLPSDKFIFEGFLPVKSVARQNRLSELKTESKTLIFYEAPHRIEQTISDLNLIMGETREAVICRELTKTFETVYKNSLKNISLWLSQNTDNKKGEFVIIVSGLPESEKEDLNQIKAKLLV
jgi:16S rRNA (cytidine1402-2'-O)-methyltransferase